MEKDRQAKNILTAICNTRIGDQKLQHPCQSMSLNDWEVLKADIKSRFPDFRWPSRFTWTTSSYGVKYSNLYFTKLLSELSGESWYFDDNCLVVGDKTYCVLGDNKNLCDIIVDVAQSEFNL